MIYWAHATLVMPKLLYRSIALNIPQFATQMPESYTHMLSYVTSHHVISNNMSTIPSHTYTTAPFYIRTLDKKIMRDIALFDNNMSYAMLKHTQ